MIGLAVQCRLGNQLFQYAFIRSVAEKYHTGFFVSEVIDEFTAARYFDLKGYSPISNKLNWLLFKLSGHIFKKTQSEFLDQYRTAVDNKVYTGYFQSEKYFFNIRNKVQSYIRVKQPYRKSFEQKYGHVFSQNRVIAIHIRRGDYLELNNWWSDNLGSNNLSLPVGYYKNCLNQLGDLSPYKIIFVGDDMDYAHAAFGDLVKDAIFQTNDMITDFQILMNADICILSNSSFAWWAAYLNIKKDKKIYCPEYWLGFKIGQEYPEDIIAGDWIQIKVPVN